MAIIKTNVERGVTGTMPLGNGGTGVTTAADLANTGNMVLLNSGTISSATAVEFNSTYITDTYKFYDFYLSFYTASNFQCFVQTSTDNGSSYAGGASDYAWVFGHTGTQGGFASIFDQDDTAMIVGDSIADGAALPWSGRIRIMNPTDSSIATTIQTTAVGFHETNEDIKQLLSFGRRQAAEDNNAIRFTSSQTMTAGNYALYGYKR
jgi:hypothetical protein